jgi:hypothetical protein
MDKVEDIVARLRREYADHKRVNGKTATAYFPVNRDGPEAADLIQSQQALIEEMREVFTVFMRECPDKLDCGRHCQLEIERHEEEAFMAAYANAEAVLSKALSQKDQIDG